MVSRALNHPPLLPTPDPRFKALPGAMTTRAGKINYPKKRVSVACDVCRSRKTRCDAHRPACSFCEQLGIRCVYRRHTDSSRPDDSSSSTSQTDIITRLERLESLVEDKDSSPALTPQQSYHTASIDGHSPLQRPLPPSSPVTGSAEREPRTLPLFGYRLDGLSRLGPETPSLPALAPLRSFDVDAERELEAELFGADTAASGLFSPSPDHPELLDTSPRLCWYLEQAFSRDVLPWCPIVEHRECAALVARVADDGFPPGRLETAMALLIMALGAFARGHGSHHASTAELPGIAYFRAGRQIINAGRDDTSRYSMMRLQCEILITFYLLFSLKPVLAFEVLHTTALRLLMLLQLKSRAEADPIYQEMLHRAYWTCYLLEHELQAHVSFSARLLQGQRDSVPLPLSDYDEPGMYWFLSEIALRGICSSMRDGVVWNEHMINAPLLVEEVASQLMEWHSNLAAPIKFPLDDPAQSMAGAVMLRPLLDPHKIFLRAQFYAVQATMHWPFVAQILTARPSLEDHPRVVSSARLSLQYAVLHVYAVEPLMQEHHLMLFANITGLFCATMLLLCAHGVPQLADIRHPGTEAAVVHALQCLRIWGKEPNVLARVRRIENVMRAKGLGVPEA